MRNDDGIPTLEQLLERLGEAAGRSKWVTVGDVFEVLGQESFGPLLVFGGLIAFSPLSGIPGVPSSVPCSLC
jgi:hypothetical protein